MRAVARAQRKGRTQPKYEGRSESIRKYATYGLTLIASQHMTLSFSGLPCRGCPGRVTRGWFSKMVRLNDDRIRWAILRDHIDSALHHIRDCSVVLIDEQGRIAGWNRGAEHMLGYKEADVLGQPAELFFTPEDRGAGVPQRELQTAARTGEADDERWHVRGDGSRFFG